MERAIGSYDYVIVNDTLDDALARLEAVVAHERARRGGPADPSASERAAALSREAADLRGWGG